MKTNCLMTVGSRSAQMKWDMIECIAAGVNKQVNLECSQLLIQSSWGGNSSFSGRSVGKIKGIWLSSWAAAFLFSLLSASFSSPAMHYPIQLLLSYVGTHHVYFFSVVIMLSLHHLGPWAGLCTAILLSFTHAQHKGCNPARIQMLLAEEGMVASERGIRQFLTTYKLTG